MAGEARAAAPRRRLAGVIPLPRRISLSVTLATGIGSLVALAMVLVLGFSFAANIRNTVTLLSDKSELLLTVLEDRLRDHLRPAESQIGFVAAMIEDGRLDTADPERLTVALTASMAAAPQVLGIVYWDGAERSRGVARAPDGIVPLLDPVEPGPQREALAASLTGRAGHFWGEPVYIDEQQAAALNLRHALAGSDGALVAIVSVVELSRFLSQLDRDVEGSVPFILYGDDRVLAHPNLVFGQAELSADKPLPGLFEIGDPLLVALWRQGEESFVAGDGVEAVYVDVAGDEQVMLYRRLEGFADRPLTVGIRFPAASVNQELRRLRNSGFVGLGVLVLAVLSGVFMGRRIARPVIRLAEQAWRIANLEFGRAAPLPGSVFTELDDQARAFNKMLAGLKWFETYVPRTLVRRLIAKGADETVKSLDRELTVLFTDIAGFTTISEGMSAADTAAFLNSHFALLAACVEAEGGTIDKFIGDSLMAFWGAPDRQPDHAARACRAARAMAAALADDNARRRMAGLAPIRLRIGIHSGPMVVGNIGAPGRMNYTIVGDAVNTGNRIEQLAKELAGSAAEADILVSDATARQLGADLPLTPCGRQAIRGRQQEIEVFRLG